MAAFRITVERISAGERGPGGIVRCGTEACGRSKGSGTCRGGDMVERLPTLI